MKISSRLIILILIFGFAISLVYANHSFAVYDAQLCLNGARFTASPITPESFSLQMVGQLFSGPTNVVASGTVHTFENYESAEFSVSYPEGTLAVGQLVSYSVSDVPGDLNGNQGANEFGYIEDCLLNFEASALDNRINRYDAAAPIAVYFVNGTLEIWSINSASEGTLIITLSQAEFEAASLGLLDSTGSILVYKVEGGYLIRAGMSNGKTYVLSFSELAANAAYSSYEE